MPTPVGGWFKAWGDAPDHVKIKRLARRLGHPFAGLWFTFRLWALTAKYAPADGILEGRLGRDEIEEALGWTGAPGDLIRAFLDERIMDDGAPGLRTHEWHPHQPNILQAAELGDLQSERKERRERERGERRQSRVGTVVPVEKSQYFLNWWAMVPGGTRHGVVQAYEAWCKYGLDDPGAAGDVKRAEVYQTYAAQLAHHGWRENYMRGGRNAALSYIRRRDWEHWAVKVQAPEPIQVAVVSLPERRDDTELRRDWSALKSSEGREWPGYEEAMAEVLAARKRGDN